MDDSQQIRDTAGAGMSAAAAILQSTCDKIHYKPKLPTVTLACVGLLAIVLTVGTVGTVDLPWMTVAEPSATVQTVERPSPTVGYWLSTARGDRAKIHTVRCFYHRLQTDTDGAAKRKYFDTMDAAKASNPEAGCCKRCLGKQQ